MIGKTTNALLQKTEQAIQTKIPAILQQAFQRALTAGLSIMYSPQMQPKMMQGIQSIADPAQGAARGAANLLSVLMQQSGGKIPMSLAVPVAMCFLCEFLDLMEKAGKLQLTVQVIAQATQDASGNILQMFGVSPGSLRQMVDAGARRQQDIVRKPARNVPGIASSQHTQGIIGSAMHGGF
jgi:hypothetical protein